MDATMEPRKCTFTVQIDASIVDEHEGHDTTPSFRFRFLDGSKKQTPVIGVSNGWTLLVPGDNDTTSPWTVAPPASTYRYEHVVSDVSITEAFATALDDDPMLSVFLSDHPGLLGSASGGATGGTNANSKDAKGKGVSSTATASSASGDHHNETSRAPQAYAGLYDLDLSSFLAGTLLVEQIWTHGDDAAANFDKNNTSSVFPYSSKQKPKRCPPNRPLFQLSDHACGLQYLAIRVRVNQPLLNAALTRKFNPLTITLRHLRRLPGIASTAAAATMRSRGSLHAPLRRYCKPTYALLTFFTDTMRSPARSNTTTSNNTASSNTVSFLPRMLVTPAKAQDENIEWEQQTATVTFLSARFDREELADALRYTALQVEIHDRDLTQTAKLQRLRQRWESLLTAGVDITTKQQHAEVASPSAVITATTTSPTSRTATPRTTGTQQQQQHASKPLDVFVVDETAKLDCRKLLQRASEWFPHGIATFRLQELLLNKIPQHQQRTGTNDSDNWKPFRTLRLSSDVIPKKKRAKPLGAAGSASNDDDDDDDSLVDLTPLERLVREPGTYLASHTQLALHITLQHPIHISTDTRQSSAELTSDQQTPASASSPRFSRMVLVIPYKDTRTLDQVASVMAEVNLRALGPDVPLRSYQMTADETRACESGNLDIITGAQIIDTQCRTIFLEGLAHKSMRRVYAQIPRRAATNGTDAFYRMCANEQLMFPRRLYTTFAIDLKRIKLRYPLLQLLHAPELYMRTKVSEACFNALTRLADVRQAVRLDEIAHLELFPTASMLLEVESKYGESITLEDIHGSSYGSRSSNAPDALEVDKESNLGCSPVSNDTTSTNASKSRHTKTWKAPTDSTNEQFEAYRKSRQTTNFIETRKKESASVHAAYVEKKQLVDAQWNEQSAKAPVYMYSGQKLRDALQDEMRRQLAKDHHATYTYSRDFQSLAVSLVDMDASQQQRREDRSKWTTKRGFVYPPPRRPQECNVHKDAPSEARCEDLRAPFVDNVNHPKPVSRESTSNNNGTKPEFSTLPSKDMIFGGTNGDGSVNAKYFCSVHLCGDGLRREQEEALKREQDEWERRPVVDKKQIKFLAHGNVMGVPSSRPLSQLDKITDILDGVPRSKPIRIVKNATLPSGKRVPLDTAPVTIHDQQPYAGAVATQFANTLRATDTTQFVAPMDPLTHMPKDFLFPSTTNVLTPHVKKFVSRKAIAPMQASEKQGRIWVNE
ncbi:hypothetical protein FI667_g6738, partial [Globisporangium splendens]